MSWLFLNNSRLNNAKLMFVMFQSQSYWDTTKKAQYSETWLLKTEKNISRAKIRCNLKLIIRSKSKPPFWSRTKVLDQADNSNSKGRLLTLCQDQPELVKLVKK